MIIPFRQTQITNAERFGGIEAVNRVLTSYVPRNGKGIEIYVNPTSEDKQHGYFPRITFSRTAFQVDDSSTNFKIECSLPKILFNNNVYELRESDLENLLQMLQEKLNRLGLFIEVDILRNAFISRIDYAKNILLPGNCSIFLHWVSKADLHSSLGRKQTDYTPGGSSFKSYTKRHHILAYDKVAEVVKSFYCENRSVTNDNYCQRALFNQLQEANSQIFRLEVAFLKRAKLKDLCASLNIEMGQGRLSQLFNENISKTILQHYSSRIFNSIRRLNLDNSDDITLIDRIEQAFPNITTNRTLNLLSQIKLVSAYRMDFIRNKFRFCSSQISRLRRDLDAINSTQNSPFSSVMRNIHAVESCLQEFLPIEERNLFSG